MSYLKVCKKNMSLLNNIESIPFKPGDYYHWLACDDYCLMVYGGK